MRALRTWTCALVRVAALTAMSAQILPPQAWAAHATPPDLAAHRTAAAALGAAAGTPDAFRMAGAAEGSRGAPSGSVAKPRSGTTRPRPLEGSPRDGAAAPPAPAPPPAPAVPAPAVPAPPSPTSTLSSAISFLEDRVGKDPDDFTALNLLTERYLDRLRDGGGDRDLSLAEASARRSLEAMPAEQNSAGVASNARTKLAAHRFAEARDLALHLTRILPGRSRPYLILGDALVELGSYEKARVAYAEARRIDGKTVDTEWRAARLDLIHGRSASARAHLESALALARATEPPPPGLVGWCSVQLGQLAFGQGDWARAEEQYGAALETDPNGLLALEHMAELRAAQGRYEEAIALFTRVISRSPRPEFRQALGDLYAFMGRSVDAKRWLAEALAGYQASVREGHVHYIHHLAGYFSDSDPDPEQALAWARKDLELRRSINAYDALAWALDRAGRHAEARAAMTRALATGTRDAHILYHAGIIASAAGDLAAGGALLRRAVEANPRHNTFHVHR